MRGKQENVGNGLDQVSVQRLELKISPSSRKRVIFKSKVGRNVALFNTRSKYTGLIGRSLIRPER